MNQEPKELTARLAFLQEANEQLKVFHESGRHTPGQIMDVWMTGCPPTAPCCYRKLSPPIRNTYKQESI